MGIDLLLTAISGIQHHLHTLVMWGSGITKQGAGKLASLMHKESYLRHLRILDLSDNNLGREGFLVLFQALEANPPLILQKLDLYNIGMSSEAAKALARAIASGKLSTLRKMYFGLNAIGAEGCKALLSTESVVHLANLEEFFIDRNDIGDEGALAVEMAVMEGRLSSLQELHVWDSSIGTRGAQALARALKTRQIPAQTLLLEKNDIGEAGAQAFIDALVQYSRLTAEVQLDWPSETMRKRGERARFNNQRIKKILERLGGEGGDLMQGTGGKVIVCSYGQVGKTTLTNSLKLLTGVAATLKSSPGFNLAKRLKIRSSAHKSSLRHSPDPGPKPTRGIEVCTIGWKGRDIGSAC
ncbi:hypothetical protein O6H91_20G061000 [Diphasiastrum complanatum]|uniref:Uncharacterized protein n=1 Tax=Diphasiastrum complanatum TaxID=34168 RepID=A0ACC2AR13_DIPCM|nr:hypothetical protein O6H91_20G061000 [Diphasiastrum complanatum]